MELLQQPGLFQAERKACAGLVGIHVEPSSSEAHGSGMRRERLSNQLPPMTPEPLNVFVLRRCAPHHHRDQVSDCFRHAQLRELHRQNEVEELRESDDRRLVFPHNFNG